MQEWTMAVKSRLPILIAEYNTERIRAGLPELSDPQIAAAMDMEYTRLYRLKRGSPAWKLDAMDKCMQFFGLNSFDQLFEYREEPKP